MAGIEATLFVPDLLAMPGQIKQLEGSDRSGIELVEQAKASQFTDGVRQRVDADAEFADVIALLIQFAIDAAGPQHQGRDKATDSAADDNRLHRPLLHTKPGAAK